MSAAEALARSHVRFRPKSVIGRLLSHSRKQTFAVLLHRQDCAHCRRLAKAALPLQSGRRAGARSRQLRVGKQTFKTVKALAAHDPNRTLSPMESDHNADTFPTGLGSNLTARFEPIGSDKGGPSSRESLYPDDLANSGSIARAVQPLRSTRRP